MPSASTKGKDKKMNPNWMDEIDEMTNLLREIFIWIQKDNGRQDRLIRFQRALNHGMALAEGATGVLKEAFALISKKFIRSETLRNCFDTAKEDLRLTTQVAEKRLAELKGDSEKQDQEWIDQNF